MARPRQERSHSMVSTNAAGIGWPKQRKRFGSSNFLKYYPRATRSGRPEEED
jgi:hypothetical protein